jgi:hypothetical protein
MKRWLHAWAWVAVWLWLLGRATQAFPMGLPGAVVLGAVLTPGVYLPLVLLRREHGLDLSGELASPFAVALAGLVLSAVLLGGVSLLGHWDQRPRGAGIGGVVAVVLWLHVLASICIGVAERWLWGDEDEED